MPTPDTIPPRALRHTREDVLVAALGILDTYGLADLTMRRLAATLDVQPSALYWHFVNKQTLLASIADRIVERARPVAASGDEWREATRAESYALRDALLAYRDGAEVVSSTLALGLGARWPLTMIARAIEQGGFDPRTSANAAAALVHFILGHASHEQQRLQADSLGVVAEANSTHPSNTDSATQVFESFEFGISLLISGLALQHHLVEGLA